MLLNGCKFRVHRTQRKEGFYRSQISHGSRTRGNGMGGSNQDIQTPRQINPSHPSLPAALWLYTTKCRIPENCGVHCSLPSAICHLHSETQQPSSPGTRNNQLQLQLHLPYPSLPPAHTPFLFRFPICPVRWEPVTIAALSVVRSFSCHLGSNGVRKKSSHFALSDRPQGTSRPRANLERILCSSVVVPTIMRISR